MEWGGPLLHVSPGCKWGRGGVSLRVGRTAGGRFLRERWVSTARGLPGPVLMEPGGEGKQ